MVNAFHVGHTDEILAGSIDRNVVHDFIQRSHLAGADSKGCSWAAIGILKTGAVWLMAAPTKLELIEALEAAGATEAELLELTTLN